MNAIRPFVNKAIWQSLSDAARFEIFVTLEVGYIPLLVCLVYDILFEFNSQKDHVGRYVEVQCEIYFSMDASFILVSYLLGGPTMNRLIVFKRVLYPR